MLLRILINLIVVASVSISMVGDVFACIRRHDVSDSEYISFGLDPKFNSVGGIYVVFEDGSYNRASGVLIHNSWVLTAAHVVKGTDGYGGGILQTLFYTGSDLAQYSHRIVVDDLIFHPDYVPGPPETTPHNWDVALLHLSQPINDVTPAKLYRGLDIRGQEVHWAGFGMYGTGDYGAQGWDYLKRAYTNKVDWFGGDQEANYADAHYMISEFSYPSTALPMEGHAAPGDSGGGGFALICDDWQLVGINNFVWAVGNYFYSGDSGATRESLLHDWIDTIVPVNNDRKRVCVKNAIPRAIPGEIIVP